MAIRREPCQVKRQFRKLQNHKSQLAKSRSNLRNGQFNLRNFRKFINFVDYSRLRTEIKVHQLIEHQSIGHTPAGHESLPQRRYAMRRPPTSPPPKPSVHRVPTKKSRTSSLGESSRHPQPNSRAPTDSHIPFGIGPESIIKRPMVTVPPIEGNSDCRARSFHYELYFDIEHLMTPREFFYPRVAMDFYHDYPRHPEPYCHPFYHRQMLGISEGFYFGPHHLILAAFLHFEEKVHRKRLQRADHIPLLFSRLLYHIFEHMGYPTKPHLERRHHCREHFTLNKWTHLTESVPHAPAPPMPEAVSTVPPLALITPTTLLVPKNTSITPHILPATSSTSEPFMTISTTEFCAMADIPCPSEPVAPIEDATTAKALIQTTQEAI
uniref:Uncharacterized protein n=1 Tax=Vitis vinifera TaxID=29760 RepID=A5ARQ7_VITVI|nr:hypothetical protein VITISV_016020 [Vitis vinifera]